MRKTLLRNSPSAAILGAAQMCTLLNLNSWTGDEHPDKYTGRFNVWGQQLHGTEMNVNCGITVQWRCEWKPSTIMRATYSHEGQRYHILIEIMQDYFHDFLRDVSQCSPDAPPNQQRVTESIWIARLFNLFFAVKQTTQQQAHGGALSSLILLK